MQDVLYLLLPHRSGKGHRTMSGCRTIMTGEFYILQLVYSVDLLELDSAEYTFVELEPKCTTINMTCTGKRSTLISSHRVFHPLKPADNFSSICLPYLLQLPVCAVEKCEL